MLELVETVGAQYRADLRVDGFFRFADEGEERLRIVRGVDALLMGDRHAVEAHHLLFHQQVFELVNLLGRETQGLEERPVLHVEAGPRLQFVLFLDERIVQELDH